MAQGDFTKEEAKKTMDAVEEMYKALSKPKQADYFGHLNDILLFLEACGRKCPTEVDSVSSKKG